MTKTLATHPLEDFEFRDAQAETLLFEIGVIDRFKNPVSAEMQTEIIAFNEHPTHHILGFYFSGNPNPDENGFVALCLAKSEMSQPDFEQLVAGLIKPMSVVKLEAIEVRPARN